MIYSPREDSFLLEKEVKKYSKGRKVLDVGCGEGIQSVTARDSGAKSVLAVDIDKESVEFVKSKGINSVQSDLFSNAKGKFDLIIFNPPYLPRDAREDSESAITTTGGTHGDETILKFLEDAPKFLEKDGIILLVISSLTPQDKIKKILKEKKMRREIIAQERFFMEKLEVWKIKELNAKD